MAASYTLLADLKAGRCSNTAEVRLLRFWEARNINRRGELMSVEMLLIDENSTLMQGSIAAVRQLKFRQHLNEGSVYRLSGFDVARSSPKYRLSDSAHSIRFSDGTSFEKLETTARTIPTELFRFQSHARLLELANKGKQLPDVLGEISEIRSTIADRIPGAQRVMLTLRVERDVTVCVSFFDALALSFHEKFVSYGREPRVVLATGINPKLVGGKLYLNGSSATHIYFDSETAAGRDALSRLPGVESNQTSSSSRIVHSQKIEPLTVSELNQYILTAEPQVIEFLCTATVTAIDLDEGWCYIGCSACSKKLIREETSFTCASCDVTNALAELRYRVRLSVSDVSGTATFIGFDTEMAKLTLIQASEASQIVGIGVDAKVETDLPRSLADIVGKTYTFQLRLKEFNFGPNHQTFTISRIFPARELAPMPTFAVESEVRGAVPANPVLPVTVSTHTDTSTLGEQATTQGESPSRGLAAATVEAGVEDNVPKKARLE